MVSEDCIEAINNLLDDLSVENTQRFQSPELDLSDTTTSKFFTTCEALFGLIRHYSSDKTKFNTLDCALSSIDKIFDALSTAGYETYFKRNDEKVLYRILHYICTIIQAERLTSHRGSGNQRRLVASEKGKLLFQLDKLCNDVEIKPAEGASAQEVLLSVQEHIVKSNQKYGDSVYNNFPTILNQVQITYNQKRIFQDISNAVYTDFSLRRKMMMKRLDVTIQSFLWGERSVGKEGIIVAAIKGKLDHLKPEPKQYSLQDVVNAPISLLLEHSKRVTDSGGASGGKSCFVKNIIIGSVPDRGGRANEMRPKKSEGGTGSSSAISNGGTSGNKKGGGGVCYSFQKGECKRGSSCKFSHDSASVTVVTTNSSEISDGNSNRKKQRK